MTSKCRWCDEPIGSTTGFCDELCERLDRDYKVQSSSKNPRRNGLQLRAKRELTARKNTIRSG